MNEARIWFAGNLACAAVLVIFGQHYAEASVFGGIAVMWIYVMVKM